MTETHDGVFPKRFEQLNRRGSPAFGIVASTALASIAMVINYLFIYYSRNTGHSFWVYWAPFLLTAAALLLGIPVYRSQRSRMTAPAEVPPYR